MEGNQLMYLSHQCFSLCVCLPTPLLSTLSEKQRKKYPQKKRGPGTEEVRIFMPTSSLWRGRGISRFTKILVDWEGARHCLVLPRTAASKMSTAQETQQVPSGRLTVMGEQTLQ